jgi:hypothetical protein
MYMWVKSLETYTYTYVSESSDVHKINIKGYRGCKRAFYKEYCTTLPLSDRSIFSDFPEPLITRVCINNDR